MNVRYKRDLNSNYMILEEEGAEKENYEIRMLTENRIYGLLPCVNQIQEKRSEYYYEITGRQSMELLYERKKLNCDQLRELLKEFLRILEAAGEYLLNPDHFLMEPEYMYLNARTGHLYLCYFPGYQKNIRESFLDWAEYLLGKVDRNDTEGIEFGYELYQCALEPNFSLTEILHRHAEPEPKSSSQEEVSPVSVQEEVLEKTGSWKNFFKKKQKKGQLEDYLAEADQMKSGEVLFLREQPPASSQDMPIKETVCLKEEKKKGLMLKSKDSEYPDISVEGNSFIVGKRGEGVDGCIPAPTISRFHARITFDGTFYYLEDLNSTNGTWAGGIQLNPYELFPLHNGLRVTFAGAEYEVKM